VPPTLRPISVIGSTVGGRHSRINPLILSSDELGERVNDMHSARGDLSRSTRKEIKALLRGGYSHARFEKVMQEFPIDLRSVVPDGLPYSAWQVLEHMRIAQRYMLDYALQHLIGVPEGSPKTFRWPRDYWVRQQAPPGNDSWEHSVRSILDDRSSFEALIDKATDDELVTPSGSRKRKTLLRLALQISDHNSYHIGQLVIIRRLLRSWKR
jgi:DinB superfamily